ncbi:AAA ATPase central domain protein [Methanococcus vannielii SB]|jgi:AAA family ATPase|uniref:AAA ATPase central domain protein n=1 Tax=Methanococcus vannielii (strain ATCC 35089 / DSM 1224 / JCM 13029 / OCM 148 / SB) TaxID=406327 RepID=A6URH3_METVS|nr:AAA family ATPase [Methanococcus vannielii]ABR55095.1 AAA ATPase central domain protein [Methanococcus vannielii SB]
MSNINISSLKLKKNQQKSPVIPEEAMCLKYVILEPVGFPIRVNGENLKVSVEDHMLFNSYAREQWENESVKEGSYLFDSTIIPDYAFKVISLYPKEGGIITKDTLFKLENSLDKQKNPKFRETSFEEVIGQFEAKKKCKIIIKYLENPEIFGEWAPKNILFYGPPGTGKTLLARALATETDVPLYLIKATELIGDHVGDGSKQIQSLYEEALENAPCIIFIDELDAIALSRQFQSLRGDVSEVVNALLTELDGIKSNEGIVTIAATNNPEMLDSAIRSRFEEEIEFKMPDDSERLKIMELYAEKMPISLNVNFKKYVEKTKNMNGRTIKEKFLKPALHKAILEDRDTIEEADLDEVLKKIIRTELPTNLYM